MTSLALLVLGKSDEEIAFFKAHALTADDEARVVHISNPGSRHGKYAAIANPFLHKATEDVVGVVHADTTFAEGALTIFAKVANEGKVTGIVGRSPEKYVWCTAGGGVVSTLDSCSIFFPRRIPLRFDGKTFDDYHCVVEDVCMLAAVHHSMQAFVPAAQANHLGRSTLHPEWTASFLRYRERLNEKWGFFGRKIYTT